jgi:hypothetical protein
MVQLDFDPEKLRPAGYIHEPDPRNTLTAWHDKTTGVIRPVEARDLHDAVATLALHPAVPEDLGDHPKAAIDDQVKTGHREMA